MLSFVRLTATELPSLPKIEGFEELHNKLPLGDNSYAWEVVKEKAVNLCDGFGSKVMQI